MSKSIFTISLDFELYWGVRDKRSIEAYKDNLLGVRNAVPELLKLFEKNGIHATWATVGFLFFKNLDELKQNLPESLPGYQNKNLSPYLNFEELSNVDTTFLFAPELIDQIDKTPGQEIATHTFSHYYCLESGQSIGDFNQDLKKAKEIAAGKSMALKSLVFPRNQWNEKYLSVLNKLDIKCYRGNEKGWMYRASNNENQKWYMRAIRLKDAYVNISGHNVYTLEECTLEKPYNFPSSRFLRPYSKKLALLDGMKLKRIKNAMTYAAKNNKLYHLWWHPHNFGVNTQKNMAFLSEILSHYKRLEKQYGMASMNMGEIADLI
jgi:peptidoglycan/xylan/chitin deacetylase (PgdA/CDA1 family)